MGRILLIIFSFVLVSAKSFTQTVTWSQPLQDNKKAPYVQVLGSDENDNFFLLRSNISLENNKESSGFRNRAYYISYFTPSLTSIWDRELKTSYENGHITDVRMINEKVAVTSYITDRKSKKYYFYSQYLGNDGKWIGKPALLDSIETEFIDEDNKPGLIVSSDHSYIAFTYRKIAKDDASQSFRLVAIDSTLAVLYKKEIDVPLSSKFFFPLDNILTNQGSFFLLGIHYTTDKKIREPGQMAYELYGYVPFLNKTTNSVVRMENKFLTDASLSADNVNHSIIVAGFYSDKTAYSVAGVFYYSLTEDSLLEKNTISAPFSDSYLMKFFGEKKENRELVNYSIDRLIVRKDGGVGVVAESIYETSRSYYDYFMQTYVSHVYHHFGNIMLVSVNPDGKILWNDVVSKDQNSVDDGGYFSSFFSAIAGGKLVIIYNKYIEDDSSILITVVAPGGIIKTDVLVNENERGYVIPGAADQVDEETLIIPAYKNNKFHILKVSF